MKHKSLLSRSRAFGILSSVLLLAGSTLGALSVSYADRHTIAMLVENGNSVSYTVFLAPLIIAFLGYAVLGFMVILAVCMYHGFSVGYVVTANFRTYGNIDSWKMLLSKNLVFLFTVPVFLSISTLALLSSRDLFSSVRRTECRIRTDLRPSGYFLLSGFLLLINGSSFAIAYLIQRAII